MTFKEWLEIVKDKGLICDRYLPIVLSARSRKQYMDVVLDVNGMEFLCDMSLKGDKLPYETICAEFKAYLNGRYIHTKSSASGSYTSSMYCAVKTPSEVTVNTTLTGFFGCNCYVHVPDNMACQIYVDDGSNIKLHVSPNATCYVSIWKGGNVECDNATNIIIKHKNVEDE